MADLILNPKFNILAAMLVIRSVGRTPFCNQVGAIGTFSKKLHHGLGPKRIILSNNKNIVVAIAYPSVFHCFSMIANKGSKTKRCGFMESIPMHIPEKTGFFCISVIAVMPSAAVNIEFWPNVTAINKVGAVIIGSKSSLLLK